MIYMDVSETRAGTKVHDSIAEFVSTIVGLEAATGADILISTADGVLPGNVNRPPGSVLLPKHIAGGMLIQRKNGSDLLGSVDKLHNIIIRMRTVEPAMCWLLTIGSFECSTDGMVICDGRKTGWRWNSYAAVLDAWQVLGGYYHHEPTEKDAAQWLYSWDGKLKGLIENAQKPIAEKPLVPKLGMIDPYPSRVTLMTFPGLGDVLSLRIMEEKGTLASALEWMSMPESYGIRGLSQGSIVQWREWMGLKDGEVLQRFLRNGPSVHLDVEENDGNPGGRANRYGT